MVSTFEKIKELAKSRGTTLSALEEKLGLSRNSIYTIKSKKPSAERLQLIADYFQVSTDYLLGRTDNPRIATDIVITADGREVDLSNLREKIVLFDGKPLTDDDVDKITKIIKLSLGVKDLEDR